MIRTEPPGAIDAALFPVTASACKTALASPAGTPPRFVVLDIETTGFSPDRHEIIQMAAARLEPDGSIAEMFSTYVRPLDSVPWHVTVLTGIRNADLARAPTAPEALRALARFFGHVRATQADVAEPILVSHNGRRFDLRFISVACARHALLMRPVRCIDSLHLARALWPAERLHNLDTVAGRLGIDVNASEYRRHNACSDVRLLATVVRRMARKLYPEVAAQRLEAEAWEHEFVALA